MSPSKQMGTASPPGPRDRVRFAFGPVLFPLALVLYFSIAFLGYSAWCEFVRGTDPGIGETWKIPLGNGYALVARHALSRAHVVTPTGEEILSRLTAIGREGDILFGTVQGDDRYFLIRTGERSLEFIDSERTVPEVTGLPAIDPSRLMSIESFYRSIRWGTEDLLALFGIVLFPANLYLALRIGRHAERPND
ncbi:MAG: hypothetical protein Kow00128_20270 [Deltaproteobacteria bacterium]